METNCYIFILYSAETQQLREVSRTLNEVKDKYDQVSLRISSTHEKHSALTTSVRNFEKQLRKIQSVSHWSLNILLVILRDF